jgi:hypothetical protein
MPRPSVKMISTISGGSRPARPTATMPPQISMDDMKPYRPSLISARRPLWFARRAQWGAANTQRIAERLKATVTQMSGIPSWRPIEGMRDCIAVLPAAATSITAKRRAKTLP